MMHAYVTEKRSISLLTSTYIEQRCIITHYTSLAAAKKWRNTSTYLWPREREEEIGEMRLMESSWSGLGTTIASLMFLWTMVRKFLPHQFDLYIAKFTHKLFGYFYPYVEVTFHEYTGDRFNRSEAYTTIKTYLSASASERAKKLNAEIGKDSSNLIICMDDHEQVTDDFRGIKLWWSSNKRIPRTHTISFYPAQEEQRYY